MIDYSELAAYAELAKQKDEKAFAKLYEKTCGIVYGLACSMLGDRDCAEDIVQEVYLKVYLHLDQLKDTHCFISWLHMITYTTCQDHLRHESRRPQLTMPDEPDFDAVEEWLRGEHISKLFDSVLSMLPEEQRQAVYLFYYRQMTVGQIAAIQDCPIGTVKSRLMYAKRTLKKVLEDEERRSGDKLTLSPIAAALSVMMSLPVVGYTLSAEAAQRILASVLAAAGAAGAAEGGVHIVSDVTEEGKSVFSKKWLVKVPLVGVLGIIAVIMSALLIAAFSSSSEGEKAPDVGAPERLSVSDADVSGTAADPTIEALSAYPAIVYDNSRSFAFMSGYERSSYSSPSKTSITLEAARRTAEWIPDGKASEGEYFDVTIPKEYISQISNRYYSPFDTAALDFRLMMSWDEEWLYLYCELVDVDGYSCSPLVQAVTELWHESMFQVAAASFEDSDEFENLIVTMLNDGTKQTMKADYSSYLPVSEDFSVDILPDADGDRVIYELRVPFSSFLGDSEAIPGRRFRFSFVIGTGNDMTMCHTQLAEGITGKYVGVPSKFAVLQLTDTPSQSEKLPVGFDAGDVARLNAIIREHNLPLGCAPDDGSSIPDDWSGHMAFSESTGRLIMLRLSDMELGGRLDISGFEYLKIAELDRTGLEALDAHGMRQLEVLCCDQNRLTELNVSGDRLLRTLSCRGNRLTELELSGLTAIEQLYCEENLLASLDLSPLSELDLLYCGNNLLDKLDLKKQLNLAVLKCECNMLTELDLSGCPRLAINDCSHNLLADAEPDQPQHLFFASERIDGRIISECECGYRIIEAEE